MKRILLIALIALVASTVAQAQQFKVTTRVTQLTFDEREPERTLSRSLTLFHAGRVYDWIPSVGEITVVDPARDRFIVFCSRKRIGAQVPFEEVTRMLGTARDETSNWVSRMIESGNPKSTRIAEPLKFQLSPKFEKTFDLASKTLTLKSPRLSYIVDCQQVESSELLDAYLEYADQAARLNYVLYPDTLYPDPRLALNDVLRKQKQLPSRVQLKVDFDQPLRLQAEHRFSWQLSTYDRRYLNQWQRQMDGPEIEWVSFREYHRRVIVQKNVQAKK